MSPPTTLDSGWVLAVPEADLNELHFALRLAAKYPGMSPEQITETTRLADVCWDEHCRRTSERIEIEKAQWDADRGNARWQ